MGHSLHLEPVGPQHVSEVQELVSSHPDIVGMTRMPDPYPEDGAATWIARAVPLHEAGEMFSFAIVLDDGRVAGMVGLAREGVRVRLEAAEAGGAEGGSPEEDGSEEAGSEEVEAKDGRAEMGYWVGGPFWSRGYATEAVRQLLEFAFGKLGVECIFATPLERNVASQKVLEKNGFELTRVYPNTEPRWEPTDRLMEFEMTRDRWSAAGENDGDARAGNRSGPGTRA